MRGVFVFLIASLFSLAVTATCPVYSTLATTVLTCASDGLATAPCVSSCGTSGWTANKCNQTLSQIYQSQSSDCVATLSASGVAVANANTYCGMTFSAFENAACNATASCPNGNLAPLYPLASCLYTVPQSLSPSALSSYSAYACLQNKDGTTGVPAECQAGSTLSPFLNCAETTDEVVTQILKLPANATGACAQVLLGPLTQYCNVSFGSAISSFCTPSGLCENAFPGSTSISMCTGIGIVVGVPVGVLILAAGGFLYYRQVQKNKKQGLLYIQPPSPGGAISFSPTMQKQSSFGALVPPPNSAMNANYYPSVAPPPMYSMSPPPSSSSSIPASKALDPATLTVRKGQLCDFYLFHDPTRENIPEHVDKLFDKYSFQNILDAVRAKYGVAPPGWQA